MKFSFALLCLAGSTMPLSGCLAVAAFPVAGAAVIKKTAVKINPGVTLFLSATAGRVKAVASAGLQLLNCITINAATVASATSTVTAQVQFPFAQGQVT